MSHDHAMPGMNHPRYRGIEQEEPAARSNVFGAVMKIFVGLIIAIDASLLAAPIYFGTVNPCNMVALSNASMHSRAVDDEIGIADEMALDVFYASSVWVRSHENMIGCAGHVGGRTISALFP